MQAPRTSETARERLRGDYAEALRAYLHGAGEAALARAYELGRLAVVSGVGVIDMVLLHQAAVLAVAPIPTSAVHWQASTQFLAEGLAPFEMTHRGFQEANATLERLNRSLLAKNVALEETARSLAEANEAAAEANRELEAFSYSVSHDLRAPLRAIDGFTQAFIEDYGAHVDENGRGYLGRVRSAAQRMGQLIDDLLLLSRVGRTVLSRERVNLSALARLVVAELPLCVSTSTEGIDIVIEDGLVVEADARLVRILLENLIGNAWKFTAKTSPRRIEIGAQRGPENVYFVRDNGAGFDMAYVDRLFAPFQRLHAASEFSGTGIGLATVRRIVNRHGGRVWAEGAVGRGATIFFTLGPA